MLWRIERTLQSRPKWVMLAVLLALALLAPAVWLDLRHLSKESLVRRASDLDWMVAGICNYYSRNVVSQIVENESQTISTQNYKVVAGGIPVPATLSIELNKVIGERGHGLDSRFVSDYALGKNTLPITRVF